MLEADLFFLFFPHKLAGRWVRYTLDPELTRSLIEYRMASD